MKKHHVMLIITFFIAILLGTYYVTQRKAFATTINDTATSAGDYPTYPKSETVTGSGDKPTYPKSDTTTGSGDKPTYPKTYTTTGSGTNANPPANSP